MRETRQVQRRRLRQRQRPKSQTAKERIISLRENILHRIVNHPIASLVALIAAIVGIALPSYDAIREPEVAASTFQAESLFMEKFALKNSSFVFAISDAELFCILDDIEGVPLRIRWITVSDKTKANINPGETVLYSCPFDKVFRGETITKASIRIYAKYKTLFINRETQSEMFNWDNVTKHWSKGKVVN
jgi:hypothetical protein